LRFVEHEELSDEAFERAWKVPFEHPQPLRPELLRSWLERIIEQLTERQEAEQVSQ
jgi:hypothetical protein